MGGLRTMKRRRREGRTDYKLRKGLLMSGLPRIVVRRTNRYFILQVVESKEAQDKVLATVTSKELLNYNWDEKKSGNASRENRNQKIENRKTGATGSLKSIPAGYLTGVLFAKKLGGKKKYIMDLGMARTRKGGRIFAVVKGLIDGGLDVVADEKVFPSEDRLSGEHTKIADVVLKCKEAILGGSNLKSLGGSKTKSSGGSASQGGSSRGDGKSAKKKTGVEVKDEN